MILKAVTLFLIAMGVLAMFGKLRLPGATGGRTRPGSRVETALKCPSCGRYRIGKTPCDCGKAGKNRSKRT
ncbi:hypothetical protein [Chachezhania sediminis]|uniref:hypothetical protein n=1 Tax=Chachezhania sediminis TaxID=2599291 RepID=UPI001E2C5C5B|nr:hypothetical protein [Chachezhania sediminis]